MNIRTRSSEKTDKLKTGIIRLSTGYPYFAVNRPNRHMRKLWQREVTRYFNSQGKHAKAAAPKPDACGSASGLP